MAKATRAPSMHDVAARAGVSHQTVSRVLNGHESIRPETRERVLEAIQALGYRRNLAARALVTGRTQTIGMIGPWAADIGPLSTLHAIERAARTAGMSTLMTSAGATRDQITEALEFLVGRGIDALALVAQQEIIAETLQEFRLDIPVVHLLTGGEPAGQSASIDQRLGVRLAVQHLVALGHRNIQLVAGPESYVEARLRRREFSALMERVDGPDLPILEGDWTADSGYAAGRELDASTTAVFCANDQMAFGLIHALADRGLSVPEDVSVVGFDDTSEARHSLPPLTTVRQDFAAVGAAAVQQIVAELAGETVTPTALIEPTLVERDTTAPPRQ